ncbi:TPA: hypothetical protein HJL26_001807 [Escherichia coli]|uniref:hypothetical protein n=1 Tax=Escherichia coli TaxID=562 RepID=UPI0003916A47|nr:hypothetical protein [Escherichia coli]EJM2180124.1 hypothetical protein [Escherichia coli]EJN6664956.1 hypothetical protein [Escherichia coli]EQS38390.1 hypothetical protein G807_02356 [Escherichia coli HVH 149 (4-4451880)]EQX34430.1 hypothetical protein G927_02506 [Escherichia coli UMEA 3172-1]MBN6132158.1 hypothetical protein [Escherichia coli]
MSENNIDRELYEKEYVGFFTEDAIENLKDVINLVDCLIATTADANNNHHIDICRGMLISVLNIMSRELRSIKSDMHYSGGIFSRYKAETAGIAKAISNK